MHLAGTLVTADLDHSGASAVDPAHRAARHEGVVEADLFPYPEQIDLALLALGRRLAAGQLEPQAQAEHLMAQADREERLSALEQVIDRGSKVRDLRMIRRPRVTRAGAHHDQ